MLAAFERSGQRAHRHRFEELLREATEVRPTCWHAPGTRVWLELIDLFADWPGSDRDDALLNAANQLAEWPPEVRGNPTWLARDLDHAPGSSAARPISAMTEARTRLYRPSSEEGILRLAASNHLPPVIELSLRNNALGDAAAAALSNWADLQTAQRLDLSDNKIGGPGGSALARSPHIRNLRTLALPRNQIGNQAPVEQDVLFQGA